MAGKSFGLKGFQTRGEEGPGASVALFRAGAQCFLKNLSEARHQSTINAIRLGARDGGVWGARRLVGQKRKMSAEAAVD